MTLIFVLVVGLLVVPTADVRSSRCCSSSAARCVSPMRCHGSPPIWLAHAMLRHAAGHLPAAATTSATLPTTVIEAAKIDGATHMTIFCGIVLPLSVPALAAFGIFQFLWVWNDLLVALVFLGGRRRGADDGAPSSTWSDSFGSEWQLLTAAAFVSMVAAALVFFALQRYFVRGHPRRSGEGIARWHACCTTTW